MKKKDTFYENPQCEVLIIESEQILCQSNEDTQGSILDFDEVIDTWN